MIEPLIEVSRIQRQLDALFEELKEIGRRSARPQLDRWRPNTDIVESEEQTSFIFELPGVDAQSISARIDNNILTVAGNKPNPGATARGGTFYRLERQYGQFACRIALDRELDVQTASAVLRNGELTIRISRKTERTPKVIELEIVEEKQE